MSGAGESIGDYLVRLGAHRGDARVGDTVALASRADEPSGSGDRAALHPLVGRNRRPGDPERAPRRSTRRPASAMPSPRRKPASGLKSTMVSRGFRRAWSARPATCRSKSTMVRCGSVPRGMRSAISARNAPRSPMTTASSTPATWWNAAATALLPRSTERHHQRRRTEGLPGGSRGGDQPAPGGPHVDGAVEEKSDYRFARRRGRRPDESPIRRRRRASRTVRREILQICHDRLAPTRFRRRSVSFPRSRSPPPASWPVMRRVIVTGGSRGLGLGIVRPARSARATAPSPSRGR